MGATGAREPLKFFQRAPQINLISHGHTKKAFHDTLSSRLTMFSIHMSDTIFVSDVNEVKYHSDAQGNDKFCHVSFTSSSQGCTSDQE